MSKFVPREIVKQAKQIDLLTSIIKRIDIFVSLYKKVQRLFHK